MCSAQEADQSAQEDSTSGIYFAKHWFTPDQRRKNGFPKQSSCCLFDSLLLTCYTTCLRFYQCNGSLVLEVCNHRLFSNDAALYVTCAFSRSALWRLPAIGRQCFLDNIKLEATHSHPSFCRELHWNIRYFRQSYSAMVLHNHANVNTCASKSMTEDFVQSDVKWKSTKKLVYIIGKTTRSERNVRCHEAGLSAYQHKKAICKVSENQKSCLDYLCDMCAWCICQLVCLKVVLVNAILP